MLPPDDRAESKKFDGGINMKKLLAFGVASVMALSLAACGGASSTAASSEAADTASSEAATTEATGKKWTIATDTVFKPF